MDSGFCPFTREFVLHCLLTLALLILLMAQGVMLDMYLIKTYHTSVTHYFWLVPDFFLVVGFGVAMFGGYQLNKQLKTQNKLPLSIRKKNSLSYKRKYYLGFNPFSYSMWFLYSSLLVAKLIIIFKNDIINNVRPDEFFGPQLLKLLLASSSLVFVFLVEGHHNAVPNSAQNTYLKFLYSGVSLDILDSIDFLTLLIQGETPIFYSFHLENVIVSFSSITFILPTLALYNLSITDYKHDHINVILLFTWKMLHLFLTNIPYMVIRLYFWTTYSSDISVFIIKNIIHIFVTLKESRAEVRQIMDMIQPSLDKHRDKATNGSLSLPHSEDRGGSSIMENDEFEDIDLKDLKNDQKPSVT